MSMPTWDEFSALFSGGSDQAVNDFQKSFFGKQPQQTSFNPAWLKIYRAEFMRAYGITLDWGDPSLRLLEYIRDRLGPDVFHIETNGDETASMVRFMGRSQVFSDCACFSDDFDQYVEQLEALLQDHYALLIDIADDADDGPAFLLVPADWPALAEKHYGIERVSACLMQYGSTTPLTQTDTGTTMRQQTKPPPLALTATHEIPRRLHLRLMWGLLLVVLVLGLVWPF